MGSNASSTFRLQRRLANACLCALKLSRWEGRAALDAHDRYACLVGELCERVLVQRCGPGSLRFALQTASLLIDGSRRCRVYFVSDQIIGLYARGARRLIRRAERRARGSAVPESDPEPLWASALSNLLDLSHRSWTYVCLAAARDATQGFRGRLSAEYLGENRQPSLAADISRRRDVRRALRAAVHDHRESHRPGDAFHRLLDRLNCLPVHAFEPDRPWQGRGELASGVLAEVASSQPPDGYPAIVGPPLGDALQEAIARLSGQRAAAGLAAEELSQELNSPNSLLPNAPHLLQVLTSLPPDHPRVNETPPAEMLRRIARWRIVTPPVRKTAVAPDADVLSHGQLLTALLDRWGPNRLEWQVALFLLLGNRLEDVPYFLRPWLPDPNTLTQEHPDWIRRARVILCQWETALESSGRDGGVRTGLMEIPAAAHRSPGDLPRAARLLADWLSCPQAAPGQWDGVEPRLEEMLRAATAVALLEGVVQMISGIYRLGGDSPESSSGSRRTSL